MSINVMDEIINFNTHSHTQTQIDCISWFCGPMKNVYINA